VTPEPFAEKYGWKLFIHPACDLILQDLKQKVKQLKKNDPDGYKKHPSTKLLKRIFDVMTEEIPLEPNNPKYRQGKTLGGSYKHWRRAKFLRRFRLFFRYSLKQKIIIFGWINDESTLRKAGSKTDAYAVFKKKLKQGNPPNNWEVLLKSCNNE